MKPHILALTLLSSGGLLGCKSQPKELPPVADGSYVIFQINESKPVGSTQWDLRIDFEQKGPFWEARFSATDPGPGHEPLKLDGQLIPLDNVITAYELGRLWLPSTGRKQGRRTPCGTVQKPKKYHKWQAFPVQGACALGVGTRYYEASTGMLVGFNYNNLNGFIKESG